MDVCIVVECVLKLRIVGGVGVTYEIVNVIVWVQLWLALVVDVEYIGTLCGVYWYVMYTLWWVVWVVVYIDVALDCGMYMMCWWCVIHVCIMVDWLVLRCGGVGSCLGIVYIVNGCGCCCGS